MSNNFEDLFTEDIYCKLNEDLKLSEQGSLIQNLELMRNQKILYDITILFGGTGIFNPKFGFLEQDLVIGKSLKVPKALEQYCYRIKDKTQIFQPELVIEIKYGNVTSHQVMTYSNIAAKIKSVFPRCRYYLLLGYGSVNIFEKLLRHGTNFDQIFNLCARNIHETKIPNYKAGKLFDDLNSHSKLKVYNALVQSIMNDLRNLKIQWF